MSQVIQDALQQLDTAKQLLISTINNAQPSNSANDDAAIASAISAVATQITDAVANLSGKSF